MATPKPLQAETKENPSDAERKPKPILPPSTSPAKHPMAVNTGAESSDADTQEPVRSSGEAEVIEESDVEEFVPEKPTEVKKPMKTTAEGKMRQIMEKVNADSEDEEELPPDATVDFGDEEEEEDNEVEVMEVQMAEKPSTPTKAKKTTPVKPKKKREPATSNEGDPESKVTKESATSVADEGKKKPKAKKDSGPAKTIKKSTESKVKGKTSKTKATSKKREVSSSPKPAAKRKPALLKKEKTDLQDAESKSEKDSKKAAGSASGKALSAKTGTKKASKSDTKASDDGKPLKAKKVIEKEGKPVKKTLVKKEQKGAIKTFSKKSGLTKGKSVAKKDITPKKAKLEKKQKSTSKKARGKPSKSSEEEPDDMELANSEEEPSADDASDSEEEEVVRTPISKLPILGNLACSSRDDNCTALLDHAVEQLGKYHVVCYGADSECALAAYIIGKDTKRGWGLLQALALSVPLVSDEWLSASISEGKWKPIDLYRSDRFGQSPRAVESVAGTGRILEGVRVKVVCTGKDTASVKKALRLCGGRVAETRMDVIINDTGKAVAGCKNVEKKWLADSIEAGMSLDYGPYILGKE